MRNLVLILLMALISCKIEKKTETGIDISPFQMWKDFIQKNPEFKNDKIPESDFFHNNEKDANQLAELTLTGKKRASSGLYSLYEQYEVDLPTVGTKQIVTDFNGHAKAIIKNISVDTIPFNKISKEYAKLDMRTDIEPLAKWKKAHWDFFESFLKESGGKPTEEMLIVAVEFKKIWPKNE